MYIFIILLISNVESLFVMRNHYNISYLSSFVIYINMYFLSLVYGLINLHLFISVKTAWACRQNPNGAQRFAQWHILACFRADTDSVELLVWADKLTRDAHTLVFLQRDWKPFEVVCFCRISYCIHGVSVCWCARFTESDDWIYALLIKRGLYFYLSASCICSLICCVYFIAGVCDCTDFTTGRYCEHCEDGYYGNALIALTGSPGVCLPCPCPDRGTCAQVPKMGDVVCTNCPTGQRGQLQSVHVLFA